MMTLLPVAAFAADRHASIVKVDDTTVEADGVKDAEFTVYVRNSNNSAAADEWVYVASERGTTDTITAKTGYTQQNVKDASGDDLVAIKANSAGKVEFKVTSQVAGDAKIAIGLNNQVYDYLTDSDVTSADALVIGTKTITFEATDASDITLVSATDRNGTDFTETLDVATKGDREYTVSGSPAVKANGVDYYELKFAVANDSNAPVEGEKLSFSANKNAVTFNVTEKETDVVGEAKVKVYADKPGSYDIEARLGSDKVKVTVTFAASDVNDLEVTSDLDPKVAINEDKVDSFKVKFVDVNGNKIDPRTLDLSDSSSDVEFEWLTEPSDSDLNDDWATSLWKSSSDTGKYFKYTEDDLLQIYLPELEEEGNYVLRMSLDNGKYVDIDFEAKEQGDIVKITVEYDQKTLQLAGVSSAPTVKRYDADGVALSVNHYDSDLEYTVSDYRKLYNGNKTYNVDGVDGDETVNARDLNATNGYIFATDNDDFLGDLTVTVVDKKEDLTASTVITIADAAIGIELESPSTVNVGDDGKVILKLVDAQGNTVAYGDATTVEFDYYVISKPAGAMASASEADKFASNLKEDGESYVEVSSNKAGDVTYTFVVTIDSKKFASNVTVNFGVPKPVVQYGAKNVTMFIGSTGFVKDGAAATMDQAPFIKDSRTFVPVRMVGEALGAEVEYDPATQVITLTRPDLTVTMTVGSNVLTKSVGSTVVSDVAPFIVVETGRTVIPFRAIAEAFGADVEPVFAADGTVTAVTFQQ